MKHIIDTEQTEKLPQYATFQSYDGSLTIHAEEEYVKMADLRALIASSPQADGMVLEISDEKLHELITEHHPKAQKGVKRFEVTDWWRFGKAVSRAMLSAYKPQADANTPPDVYDIVVDTGDGIYHTAELVHFQQSGSKRMIQVRLGEPQADDVRKDAEREWTENDGNHESSKKLANRMGRIDVKFRSGFVAKDYSPNDFDFSQSGSDHDITAFRPHKFEKAIDKARE